MPSGITVLERPCPHVSQVQPEAVQSHQVRVPPAKVLKVSQDLQQRREVQADDSEVPDFAEDSDEEVERPQVRECEIQDDENEFVFESAHEYNGIGFLEGVKGIIDELEFKLSSLRTIQTSSGAVPCLTPSSSSTRIRV